MKKVLFLMSAMLILFISCEKQDELVPVLTTAIKVTKKAIITTTIISLITQTTATSGGNITSNGGSIIIAKGICWGNSQNPTISDSRTYSDSSGTGTFMSSLTNLIGNTTYYVRSYAINSAGTVYGNQISFITSPVLLTFTTAAAYLITSTSATSGGYVNNDGGTTIIAKGICWATTSNPTILNNKTSDGSGTGAFISSITGLTPNTIYYIRAYVTNNVGTTYGNDLYFTTKPNV